MRHKRIIIHMFVPGQIAKERIELRKKKKDHNIPNHFTGLCSEPQPLLLHHTFEISLRA